MNSRGSPLETKSRTSRNYDVLVSVVGLIIGVVVILAHFLRMRNEYLIALGSVLVTACLFYFLFRKKLLKSDSATQVGNSRSHILLINIIFLLVFAASLYALQTDTPYRPLSYFILTAMACAVVAVEIVLCSESGGQIYSILGKIFILALSLRCSEYFGFASSIVGIDPWTHYEIVRDLLSQGHMQQFWSFSGQVNSYLNYPLFHLYTGMISNIGALIIKDALFFAVALPAILSISFVFLLSR